MSVVDRRLRRLRHGVDDGDRCSGSGAGHAIAGAIGGALLWAVAASLVGQVYLLGLSLVYLRVTEGLDLTARKRRLRGEARRRQAAHCRAGREGAPGDTARQRRRRWRRAVRQPRARRATPRRGTARLQPAARVHGGSAAGLRHRPDEPPACRRRADDDARRPARARARDPDIELPFDEPAPTRQRQPDAVAAGVDAARSPPGAERRAPASAAPMPAATTCPQCLSPVAAEDVFCGVCGYRLK